MKEIEVFVYSQVKTVSEIKKFLKAIERDYDEFIDQNMNCNSYCFIFNKMDDLGRPLFIKNRFESTKTFDNLIFRDKHLLKERLDFFLNKKEFYLSLGIPYTLGLLFHGYPGTGKTSTIKAIANYTKRHIIIIPMNKIHNISTLRDIILNEELGYYKIPQHKRLYVFEEIDCNGMEKIIKTRTENEKDETLSASSVEDIRKLEEKLKSITEVYPKTDDDKVTLGGFLELLDGINEATGRIMIMTTNSDPEKFDKAFQRPGRIDCKIQFQKCNRKEIEELYRMWFPNQPITKENLNQIGEDMFTPAELGELFIRHVENPAKVVEHLITETIVRKDLKDDHVV